MWTEWIALFATLRTLPFLSDLISFTWAIEQTEDAVTRDDASRACIMAR